jgi:hypothetical protein
MCSKKNGSERYFGKKRKILKRANFERSPRDLLAKYQKSVLLDISKHSQNYHTGNEADMARSDVLEKLAERKYGQGQATLKTRKCTLFWIARIA